MDESLICLVLPHRLATVEEDDDGTGMKWKNINNKNNNNNEGNNFGKEPIRK